MFYVDLTKDVVLNDTAAAQKTRDLYDYGLRISRPRSLEAGELLGNAFANWTQVLTNGTGAYTMSAQEDNASFEAMIRADKAGLLDFSRVILLRTASDIDRAPPGVTGQAAVDVFLSGHSAVDIALENIYLAGWPVVKEIAYDWDAWKDGTPVPEGEFFGDVLQTIGTRSASQRQMSRRGRVPRIQ